MSLPRLIDITPRRGINDEGKGKKHALHLLIHALDTTSNVLWLHDDDIVLPSASHEEALAALGDNDLLILPLRMVTRRNTLIERLQVIEYEALQELTLRCAEHGHPILCSGANLIVRREVWLDAEPYLHPEIPSGDDMFLLEYCKRKSSRSPYHKERNILITSSRLPSLTATVTALPSLRALLRQRRRWAGKAPHYTDRDIRIAGIVVLTTLILQLLCPPFVLLLLPFECALLKHPDTTTQTTSSRHKWYEVLLLALVYPYYALACLIPQKGQRPTW